MGSDPGTPGVLATNFYRNPFLTIQVTANGCSPLSLNYFILFSLDPFTKLFSPVFKHLEIKFSSKNSTSFFMF